MGKRKKCEGRQRVNEGGGHPQLCLSSWGSAPPAPGLIPSHARPGVIPPLPVVNYFQSKCETIKQTEGQSLLIRSKPRALQRSLRCSFPSFPCLLLEIGLGAAGPCSGQGEHGATWGFG